MARNKSAKARAKRTPKTGTRFFERFSSMCGVPAGWLEIAFRGLLLGLTMASGLILYFQVSTYEAQRQLTRDHLKLSDSFRELAVSQSAELQKLTTRIGEVETDAIAGLKEQSETAGLTRNEISGRVNEITRSIDDLVRDMSDFGVKLDEMHSNIGDMNAKQESGFDEANEKWQGLTADQTALKEELLAEVTAMMAERCTYGAWLHSQHIESVDFHSALDDQARDRFVNTASTLNVSIGYGDCGSKFLFAPEFDPKHSKVGPRLVRLSQDLGAELVYITPAGPIIGNAEED